MTNLVRTLLFDVVCSGCTKSLRQNKIMCILSLLKVQQVNEPICGAFGLPSANPLLSARFYGLLFHRDGKNMITFFLFLFFLLSVSCDQCDAGNSYIKEPKKWFKWVDFSVTPTLLFATVRVNLLFIVNRLRLYRAN